MAGRCLIMAVKRCIVWQDHFNRHQKPLKVGYRTRMTLIIRISTDFIFSGRVRIAHLLVFYSAMVMVRDAHPASVYYF